MSRIEKNWLILGLIWVGVVFYLSLGHVTSPIELNGIDKFYHFVTYAFLSLWFLQIEILSKKAWTVIILLVLMGVGIEFLQSMTTYRMFEYADMLANSIGVIIGWIFSFTFAGNVLKWSIRSQ